MKLSPSSKSTELVAKWTGWSARRPVLAIALISLVAVAVNCYPIIFCGKSYVAPVMGLPMLYEAYPTLPGMDNTAPTEAHGSDTGGTLIWGVPIGYLESRSILDHGELPLWNRYSHAGDTLIGQSISMIGDPLQWIVILGRGCALAQDLKFLLAKLLFAIGFGWLIWRLLGSLPLALIFAAMAPYCGAYYFIYNHPAFFVFSYTPWILLSALEFLNLQSRRYVGWGLAWLLANFACFNGGHIETAVILIGGLNLAALAFALAANRGLVSAVKVLLRLTIGTILFLAFTAPVWLSFLVSLQGAFTIHSRIDVVQIRFASLLGIFDGVFFRLPVHPGPVGAPAPAANLLVFVGCVYSMIRWRMLKNDLFFWINTGAIALWGGCVFGWVPNAFIAAIPFVSRIGHTHTDFSYLLVIHFTIQCAYGFKCLAREPNLLRAAAGLWWVSLVLVGMTLLYCFGFEHGAIPWIYYAAVATGAFAAPLLFAWLKSRPPIPPWGWLAILVLGFVPNFRFGLYTFGNENLLTVLRPRVTLDAPSPALAAIKADPSVPFRVTGAENILYGDYSAVYSLENISSCAPLSNVEFINLVRGFPGMLAHSEWECELTNLVTAHGLLNLLNVKYVLTPSLVSLQDGLGFRLAARNDLGVLENLDVWPRAFFSDAVVSTASTQEFIARVMQSGRQPFAALTPDELAQHPELLPLRANSKPTIAPATNYQLLPNSTAFDIHANAAGVVCLTEGQAKDFTATANGELKTVLTVNQAFKGVYLDKPGDYHIQFTYRPRYWRPACALFWTAAGLTVALSAAGIFFGKRKEVEAPPNPDIPTA
jgi:hypothetical protein